MSIFNSNMVIRRMPWHANMTEKNHLGAAMIIKPEIFEGKMTQLFTSYIYSGNPLTTQLGISNTKTINSDEWEWGLKGANSRPLVTVENLEASNTTPGKFGAAIKVVLDESWYLPGDVLAPNGHKETLVRIVDNPTPYGTGYLYLVRLMDDADTSFLNPDYLAPGVEWPKLFSQYGEASEQSGSTQYALPITLKSRLSRYRKQYKVTGDVDEEVLAVQIPDSNGKMHSLWIKYAEVEYWKQWYRELELGLWYSRTTDTIPDANGRPIYSGPGVNQILFDSGITEYYTDFTATLIEEFLMDVFYGRVKPGGQREIKAFTGEYGLLLFHRAMEDWISNHGNVTLLDSYFVNKTKSDYNKNALQVGYQYLKYLMPNGAILELVHNPIQDDRTINSEIDPITGYPIESMKFYFMDFSGEAGNSNVQIVKKNRSTKLGYVAGLTNPYGPSDNKLMSHSGDYYEMHVQTKQGIHIEDPTRCGVLALRRN